MSNLWHSTRAVQIGTLKWLTCNSSLISHNNTFRHIHSLDRFSSFQIKQLRNRCFRHGNKRYYTASAKKTVRIGCASGFWGDTATSGINNRFLQKTKNLALTVQLFNAARMTDHMICYSDPIRWMKWSRVQS